MFQALHRRHQLVQQMHVVKLESGQRQAQEEVLAIAVERAPPVITQPPGAACPPFRRSSRVRKAPDRLIETI